MELNYIISRLQTAFLRNDIKKEILEPEWYKKNIESGIPSTGFCFVASEVIYWMTGGKSTWKKVTISRKIWEHGTHCYLVHKTTDKILDVTANQYTLKGIKIPYELGKGCGFYPLKKGSKARKLALLAGLGDILKQ